MSHLGPHATRLRAEYQGIAQRLGKLVGFVNPEDDPEILRLTAREMEIVDEIRLLKLNPDVLVAAL